MPAHRSLRDFDWLMLILVSAICALGVLQIYSATRDTHLTEAWWKQAIWILGGFIALWIGTLIDYHSLLGQAYVFYGLAVATLAATFAIGMTAFGSRRWIGTASYHIQVSEFVKLVIVLLVARYLSEQKGDQLELRDLLKLAGLVGVPMILVMIQPDLGTALTYVPILGVGVFLAGFRWQYAAAILVIVVVVVPISAIVSAPDGSKTFSVYLVQHEGDKDVARRRSVTPGSAYGNLVAVASGVNAGERVMYPVCPKDSISGNTSMPWRWPYAARSLSCSGVKAFLWVTRPETEAKRSALPWSSARRNWRVLNPQSAQKLIRRW